jgi:hypothetical protein
MAGFDIEVPNEERHNSRNPQMDSCFFNLNRRAFGTSW